jgi:catechol 2,3-dioxygenase-like lactoylglutathione lyase family enzyme
MSKPLLDHVAIVSRDMEADMEFYARLGFVIETRYDDWVIMRDSNGRGVALLSPGGVHPAHFALRVPSRDEVDRIAREHDETISEHRDGSVSVYLKDPSGNSVEIISYPGARPPLDRIR